MFDMAAVGCITNVCTYTTFLQEYVFFCDD
jgi:hypothetical protein